MRPSEIMNSGVYSCLIHSVSSGESALAELPMSWYVGLSYVPNVIFRQYGPRVIFSNWLPSGVTFAARLSSLFDHIINVVFLGSKKQVRRIAASSVVTCMQNEQAIGNLSNFKFVNKTISKLWPCFCTTTSNLTTFVCLPVPTLVGRTFDDVAPKSEFERYRFLAHGSILA